MSCMRRLANNQSIWIAMFLSLLAGCASSPKPSTPSASPQRPQSSQPAATLAELDTGHVEIGPATLPGPATAEALQDGRRRIVFVIDTSASMIPVLRTVKEEVSRAARQLPREALFNVIVDLEGKTSTAFPDLIAPSKETATVVDEFLGDVTATGDSSVELALAAAARLRPDVIWFLSDGDFSKPAATLAAVKAAARLGGPHLNVTTAFAKDAEHRATLAALAAAGNGVCVNEFGRPVRPGDPAWTDRYADDNLGSKSPTILVEP